MRVALARLKWVSSGVGQQALLSVGTWLLAVVPAGLFSAYEYGVYAAGIYVIYLSTSLVRAAVGDPLVAGAVSGERLLGAMLSAGTAVSLILLPAAVGLTYALTGSLQAALAAGLAAPATGRLDSARCVAVVRGSHSGAVLADLFGVCIAVTATALMSLASRSAVAALIAFALAFWIWSLLMARAAHGATNRTSGLKEWWRSSGRYSRSYIADTALGASAGLAVTFAVGAMLGVASLGAYRLGITVFGLSSVFIAFSKLHGTAAIVARVGSGRRIPVGRSIVALVAGPILAVLATAALLLALPASLLSRVLGPTFLTVAPVLPALVSERLAAAVSTGPTQMLRILGGAWLVAAVRLLGVVVIVVMLWPMIAWLGLSGAYLSEAAGTLAISAAAVWAIYRTAAGRAGV